MSLEIFRNELKKARMLTEFKKYNQSNNILESQLGKYNFYDKTVFIGIGLNNYYLGEIKKAIDCANQAISLDPTMSIAFYLKALSHQKEENYSKQVEHINIALELRPNSVDYLNNKAEYFISTGQNFQALQILENIEAIEPNNEDMLYSFCRVYLIQKWKYKFERMIAKAISLYPNHSGFHYLLSYDHLSSENYNAAIICAKNALEINPMNTDAVKTLKTAEFGVKHAVSIGFIILLILKFFFLVLNQLNN